MGQSAIAELYTRMRIFEILNFVRGTIVPLNLETEGNKKFVQGRPKKNFSFKLYMTIFAKNSFFFKFDPLTATGMALCVDPGPKCQNLFCLV
jgi:hypothetical protein